MYSMAYFNFIVLAWVWILLEVINITMLIVMPLKYLPRMKWTVMYAMSSSDQEWHLGITKKMLIFIASLEVNICLR